MHSDSESVIRRMRRKRRHIVRRRRRARVMFAGVAVAFALSTALAVAGFTGTDLTGAAAARARNFIDLIGERSPGERTQGQLTKTKVRRLSAMREAIRNVPLPAQLTEVLAPPPPGYLPVDLPAPPAELALTPIKPVAAFLMLPGGGGSGPPGGGPPGGGGTPGGGSPPGSPSIPTPPIPAVPEPGTWLTMLAGFAAMGWSLRRERATKTMGAAG